MNLSPPLKTLSRLLAGIVEVTAVDDVAVSGLTIDSRKVTAGDVFIALPGTQAHGNQYIEAAIRKGAIAVIIDSDSKLPSSLNRKKLNKAVLIKIHNVSQQAGIIASRFYGNPSKAITVTGVTGTNGKTSCCSYLAQSLNHLGSRSALIGTLGFGLWGSLSASTHTTPDAVELQKQIAEMVDLGADQLFMEVSSHGLDQERVAGTDFNTAIFTNLTQDHLDYHGSMQHYAQAKAKLFQQKTLQRAIINSDDAFGQQLLSSATSAEKVISYGIDSGDVRATKIRLHTAGFDFTIQSPAGVLQINSHLMGQFSVYNLLACAAVLLASGYAIADIEAALSAVESAAGRMESFASLTESSATMVVDFAHTPDALKQALMALRAHSTGDTVEADDLNKADISGRKIICVFGCGGDRDKSKRPQMGKVAERYADVVIITDDNPRHENPASIRSDILSGIDLNQREKVREISGRSEAIRAAWASAEAGDIILIAGKGHETTQQVGDLKIPFSDRAIVKQLLSDNGGMA